jgi:ribonuclease HI
MRKSYFNAATTKFAVKRVAPRPISTIGLWASRVQRLTNEGDEMPETGGLTVYTDGASRGNPGPAAYAYVIARGSELLAEEAGCLGEMTNNQAEYTALVRALEHALELGPEDRVVLHSDSELMVKQLNGEYRVKNEELKPLYEQALRLRRQFQKPVSFRHVRREYNKRADELCNEALDGLRSSTRPARPKGAAEKAPPVAATAPVPSRPREDRSAPPPAIPGPAAGLHDRAVSCLQAAAEVWARGETTPTPEEVWGQLTALLKEHWLTQMTPPGHTGGP